MTTPATHAAALDPLFAAGAHIGYKKSRRHPSTAKYIFGVKNTVEILDLEKTAERLARAKEFAEGVARAGGQILFVSSKPEARAIVIDAARASTSPFVAGRWIGGTLTNFAEIGKRVARLERLRGERERGELDKYTKHERLLLGRDIEKLDAAFGGLVSMAKLPAALFVIDPKEETSAVREAVRLDIPIIALANTDCDISGIAYPVPANDSARASIALVVGEIASAITRGAADAVKTKPAGAADAATAKTTTASAAA